MKNKLQEFGRWVWCKVISGLEFISLQEREKRAFFQYNKERNYYEQFSDRELSSRYVNIKAAYEHKKTIASLFLISILLAILTGVWRYFFEFK